MCLNTSEQQQNLVNNINVNSPQANKSLFYRLPYSEQWGLTSAETKMNHSLVKLHPHRTDWEFLEEKQCVEMLSFLS